MKNDHCGMDQYSQNFFTYENPEGKVIGHVDEYAKALKKHYLKYRWSKVLRTTLDDEEDTYIVHAVDPTGFGIKFIGKGKEPPQHIPTETGFCKSNDGCLS